MFANRKETGEERSTYQMCQVHEIELLRCPSNLLQLVQRNTEGVVISLLVFWKKQAFCSRIRARQNMFSPDIMVLSLGNYRISSDRTQGQQTNTAQNQHDSYD